VTFAASGHLGMSVFTAAESFKAVLDSRSGLLFGGGGEARLRSGLLFGVRVSRFERSGARVFVHQGQVFDLGIPATVTLTPVEAVAGYRFGNRAARALPYVGGGVGWHRYQERSDFATTAENVSETFTGYHVLGGVEWRATPLIGFAGEAQWTTVPDALGQHPGSVSAAFGERNLGGVGARVRVIVGR
jgi:opacity protein-like surface antigen